MTHAGIEHREWLGLRLARSTEYRHRLQQEYLAAGGNVFQLISILVALGDDNPSQTAEELLK